MADKFVVYVFAPPAGEAEAAAVKLAELLKLEPSKVSGLIRRLPDVVTRPVSEREALAAGRRFQQAGFYGEVRNAETHEVIERLEVAGRPSPTDTAELAWADDGAPDYPQTETPEQRAFGRSTRVTEPRQPAHEAETPSSFDRQGSSSDFDWPADDATTDSGEFVVEDTGSQPVSVADRARAAVSPAAAARRAAIESETALGQPVAVQEAANQSEAEAVEEPTRRRRGSLSSKLLSTAIIPVLLTIVGALAATWFTARPALYDQLLESARNPAIATAATLSSTLERAGSDGIDHLQLLETILITRQAFARQNLSFILATDTHGNPYSGSFLGGSSFPEESVELQEAVRERAVHAVAQGTADRSGWAEEGATSHVEAAGGQRIEIVAQPLMQGNIPIGAVVVGVTDQAVTQQVNRIVINVLLFSLIPLLLAILIATIRARRLTNNVLTLTRKADEISRGDLEEPVALRSNDELDDLSAALERMRVSMSGALERLRRRR